MTNLAQACEAEVKELHAFFVEWMTGALPPSDDAFARAEQVLASDFYIISPRGTGTERAALMGELRGAHGARPDFTIWIEAYRALRLIDDLCLVAYEEWQRQNAQTTGRLSTALFRARSDTPNGVEWLHVHETWLPGHAPA